MLSICKFHLHFLYTNSIMKIQSLLSTLHLPLLKIWFQTYSIPPVHLYSHSCLYLSLLGNHCCLFHQDHLQQCVSYIFSWNFFPTSNTGMNSLPLQYCSFSERNIIFLHHDGILFSVLVLILRLPNSVIYSDLPFLLWYWFFIIICTILCCLYMIS